MSKEFMLFNIDSGDMIHLGNQRHYPAIPGLGLNESHRFFDEIPHFDSVEPPDENSVADFRDFYKSSAHALNFFLAHSRGCRLIVMDIDDVFSILAEFEQDYPGMLISNGAQDHIAGKGAGAIYFARRLKHVKSQEAQNEDEKKLRDDRLTLYRNEIKEVLRKCLVKDKIGDTPAMILQTGDLPPNPVFTPWDDL